MSQETALIIFVFLVVLAALMIPPGPGSPLPDHVQTPESC
jgi:hypothetical protein